MTAYGRWLLDAFLATGLVKSAGEFKRLVAQGGLRVSVPVPVDPEVPIDRTVYDEQGWHRITPQECGIERKGA